MTRYTSPRAVESAVKTRARQRSQETGIPTRELITRFYLCRLIHRVFDHDPHWLLKGAQGLLHRWDNIRFTQDIDLAFAQSDDHAQPDGLDRAADTIVEAAGRDLGDYIRFEHLRTEHSLAGRRVTFAAYLGTKVVAQKVAVDVVTGPPPLGQPYTQPLALPFRLDLDPHAPAVATWPLEDHVADKIAALYERHHGQPSSRVKDLIDLVIIASHATLDGSTAHACLRREERRRRQAGTDIQLPAAFTVADPSWPQSYQSQARHAPGLPEQHRTLESAADTLDRLISPLLGREPPQTWDPTAGAWTGSRPN